MLLTEIHQHVDVSRLMIQILLSSPAEASLHLVGDHQHVILGAQLTHLGQVTLLGNHHPCLTLDRLKHETTHVGVLKLFLHTHTHTHIHTHMHTRTHTHTHTHTRTQNRSSKLERITAPMGIKYVHSLKSL